MDRDDCFELLGVSRDATRSEVKAAFRARVRALHPDRHGGDPAANERFKRVVLAYERILHGWPDTRTARQARRPAPPRRRERYRCLRCGDDFAHHADCPRCEQPLWDARRGAPRAVEEAPGVSELIQRLERRLSAAPRHPMPAPLRSPYTVAAAFALFGAAVAAWGPTPVGALCVLYATALAGWALHERWTQPTWA